MDLRAAILKEHSKVQAEKIAKWIGRDADRFDGLMTLFLNDEYRAVQRAAWIISLVAAKHPGLIYPNLEKMVKRMAEPGVHVAVKRNVVRVLQHLDIPEELHGEVMNTCFELLADPKETVAVRCFSMTVLDNLSKTYPEIRQELRVVIEEALEQGVTAGFRSRARKVLQVPKKHID
jgi:hypothetical protein